MKPKRITARKIAPRVHLKTGFHRLRGRSALSSSFIATSFLLLVSSFGLVSGEQAELLHHRKLIKCRPLLFYFAVHDPPDRDSGLFHSLTGGRQAVTGPGVRTARNPIHRHHVPFGDQLLWNDR